MEQPKTGIQLLQEILSRQITLDRRMQVIEQTQKEVLNKLNTFVKLPKKPDVTISSSSVASQLSPALSTAPKQNDLKRVRVIGTAGTTKNRINGAFITIFNQDQQIVGQCVTKENGEFEIWLSAGKYSAKYLLPDVIDTYREFEVKENDTCVRIPKVGVNNNGSNLPSSL